MTAQSLLITTVHRNDVGPQTLSALMDLIERDMADEITRGSAAAKRRISAARTTTKHLEQFAGAPAQVIRLDDLVGIDPQLVAFVEGQGIVHPSAIRYVRIKNKLLECAHAAGWTCKSFELRQACKSSRSTLKRHSGDGLSIIDDAIRGGEKVEVPEQLLRPARVGATSVYGKRFDVSRMGLYLDDYFRSQNGR